MGMSIGMTKMRNKLGMGSKQVDDKAEFNNFLWELGKLRGGQSDPRPAMQELIQSYGFELVEFKPTDATWITWRIHIRHQKDKQTDKVDLDAANHFIYNLDDFFDMFNMKLEGEDGENTKENRKTVFNAKGILRWKK